MKLTFSNKKLQTQHREKTFFALLLITISVLFLFSSCSNDGEILATFENGKVTRGELRNFMETFNSKPDNSYSVAEQDNALRMISMVTISFKEAMKDGSKNESDYLKEIPLFEEQVSLEAFMQNKLKNEPREKFRMMKIQHLFLKDPTSEPSKDKTQSVQANRDAEANDLLKQLTDSNMSATDIENLISEKTELENYKPLYGYQEPICVSCSRSFNKQILDSLDKATTNTFIMVPHVAGGYWIVRKLEEKEIDGDDLKSYMELNGPVTS